MALLKEYCKMWLSAPQEAKRGFEPDEQNKWMCPGCLVYSGFIPEKPYRFHCRTCQGETFLQPIPRLDQLLKMVKNGYIDIGRRIIHKSFTPSGETGTLFNILVAGKKYFVGDSFEEAVLHGIGWERGYQWKEGKWVSTKTEEKGNKG